MSSPTAEHTDECPLHTAMSELARISVSQHVLYLAGECLPRPELLAELQTWTSLHTLIRNRICVALRSAPLPESEFDNTVASALAGDRVDVTVPQHLRQAIRACGECNGSQTCPLA
jgi:hypothetical protein